MRKVWGAADLVSGCWPQTEQERFLLPNKHFFISPTTQEKNGRAACNDPYLTFLVRQRPLYNQDLYVPQINFLFV